MEHVDADPQGLSEVDLLMRVARRWRRASTDDAGLTPHQERALLAVARLTLHRGDGAGGAEGTAYPGVRVSVLAEHLGIAARSATEVADALETAGLLTRSPDPTDRRAVLLAVSDQGRDVVADARRRRREAAESAMAVLSPDERAELRRLLTRLLDG